MVGCAINDDNLVASQPILFAFVYMYNKWKDGSFIYKTKNSFSNILGNYIK